MSRLRFGLVGCGSIARKHAHALHEYLDQAEIGAFVDLDLARAQQLSQSLRGTGLPEHPRDDGGGRRRIDVFSVLTPSGSHCANVLELAQYARPIVVEKPMALKLDDADRMIEACDVHGVKPFVVHQNR
jgi:predicted dehydrogenase